MKQAIVAVIRRENLFLFTRRAPSQTYPGYWTPVTGAIEHHESQADAVIREVREEVSLSASPLRKVWECPTQNHEFILHWWLAHAPTGDVAVDGVEVDEAVWIEAEHIARLITFPDTLRFFREILPELA